MCVLKTWWLFVLAVWVAVAGLIPYVVNAHEHENHDHHRPTPRDSAIDYDAHPWLFPSTNGTIDSSPYWDVPTRWVLASTLVIFMILALAGNSLVIIVIVRHPTMRTRTNLFLCNLAIVDLLTVTFNMPVSLATVIRGRLALSDAICQLNGFAMPFLFVTNIHTLMYISIHKCISIRRPFSQALTRDRILLLIAAAWFWGALGGYLTVHGLTHVHQKPYTTQCGPHYPQSVSAIAHHAFFTVSCYAVPLGVIAIAYTSIFHAIRAHAKRLRVNTSTAHDVIFMQQRRIAVTLLLVLLTFVFAWTPYIIYSVYTVIIKDKKNIPHLANPISYWFGYMNSVCNPIIYALRSSAFREGYRLIICREKPQASSQPPTGHVRKANVNPFSSFHHFLKQTLMSEQKTPLVMPLNQHEHRRPSDLFDCSTPGGCTGANSRRSSFSSFANMLLFPKQRCLSTNSLPGNFRYAMASSLQKQRGVQTSMMSRKAAFTEDGQGGQGHTADVQSNDCCKAHERDVIVYMAAPENMESFTLEITSKKCPFCGNLSTTSEQQRRRSTESGFEEGEMLVGASSPACKCNTDMLQQKDKRSVSHDIISTEKTERNGKSLLKRLISKRGSESKAQQERITKSKPKIIVERYPERNAMLSSDLYNNRFQLSLEELNREHNPTKDFLCTDLLVINDSHIEKSPKKQRTKFDDTRDDMFLNTSSLIRRKARGLSIESTEDVIGDGRHRCYSEASHLRQHKPNHKRRRSQYDSHVNFQRIGNKTQQTVRSKLPNIDDAEMSATRDKTFVCKSRWKSGSDPCLTFQKIKEKMAQREFIKQCANTTQVVNRQQWVANTNVTSDLEHVAVSDLAGHIRQAYKRNVMKRRPHRSVSQPLDWTDLSSNEQKTLVDIRIDTDSVCVVEDARLLSAEEQSNNDKVLGYLQNLPSPHKRCPFVGYYSVGEGSSRETAL